MEGAESALKSSRSPNQTSKNRKLKSQQKNKFGQNGSPKRDPSDTNS